ncbi:hypothetical protein BaRGS_00010869 [Batillaria attramentaria]|uniref:Uncharacterized protein n=1 Tax=Batillaria attramentaria TaxID=370345 RepID=A0ABD0LFG8_9CAEN
MRPDRTRAYRPHPGRPPPHILASQHVFRDIVCVHLVYRKSLGDGLHTPSFYRENSESEAIGRHGLPGTDSVPVSPAAATPAASHCQVSHPRQSRCPLTD